MDLRLLACGASLVLGAAASWAQGGAKVALSAAGWTVAADPASQTLEVTHEKLGAVAQKVRLSMRGTKGAQPLTGWSLERSGANQLVLTTAQPRSGWVFELQPDYLKISTTLDGGVIAGRMPAPADRMPVRLLDTQGSPVDWVGTNEVAGGYGGSETRNPSFLPRKDAECMYFTLGRTVNSKFHELFDRKTDIAISLPETARLSRDQKDPDVLDLTMTVAGNAVIRLLPDYYTHTLGVPYYVPFDDSYFSSAPMVWSSWTSYYEAVTEADVVRNADWLAANLKPYGFQYVQLDDGYDRAKNGYHYWIDNWDKQKFPHGPQWLTNYIKSKGLWAGLWLVPNAYAGMVETRPDWYLRYKSGNIVLDYNTPALDSTNPAVLEHLRRLFQTLDDWGFDYYKFDGEHAVAKYVPNVDLGKLHEPNADLLANYRERMKVIRETLGPKRFIEGCPAGTPLNGIGFMNSYFMGHDLYNNWQGMYPLFSSINANAFLNHLLVYVMPGEGLELGLPMTVEEALKKRPPVVVETARTRESPMTGFGTTLAEARTLVSYVSLTGVAYPLASVMPELPEERVRLLKATMPTLPILPSDLFSRGTDMQWDKFKHTQPDYYVHNYPEILNVKVNSTAGVYDIVGLTNWRSGNAEKELDLAGKLGLDAERQYVVFDFWNQKLLGTFKRRIPATIESHDTRVLLIHPLLDRPQLIGLSRHISGVYSIERLEWSESAGTLSGTSRAVPGDPYTLWLHVPLGTEPRQAKATAAGHEVAVRMLRDGESLMVRFDGQKEPVDWEVAFTRAAR